MRLLLFALLVALLLARCAESPRRPTLPPTLAGRVAEVQPLVDQAAARHGVARALVLGVIQVESGFDPRSCSSAGARGLMQLMPRTAESLARRLGRERYDLEDPEFSIDAGTAYLAYLLRRFDNDERLALAAYNAGPARVDRVVAEGRALSARAQRYVGAVLAARDAFARGEVPRAIPLTAGLELDRGGLRQLLRRQQELYGDRPDEPLPDAPLPDAPLPDAPLPNAPQAAPEPSSAPAPPSPEPSSAPAPPSPEP